MGSGARGDSSTLTGLRIRPATTDDLAEVSSLEHRCYSDPWPGSAFAALPRNPDVFFAVARGVDGVLHGYVVGWHVMNEAELANLAVEPVARRNGVGRKLLDAMLDDAVRRNIDRVFLEVRESNAAARQLYVARGFEQVGRRRKYYRSPEEDALILKIEPVGHSATTARHRLHA